MDFSGVVIDHCKDIFRVQLANTTTEIKAKISGKMRLNKINLQVGDQVRVEVSPYDPSMGRIVSRLKTQRDQERDQEREQQRAALMESNED